jgi:hypothetical protein
MLWGSLLGLGFIKKVKVLKKKYCVSVSRILFPASSMKQDACHLSGMLLTQTPLTTNPSRLVLQQIERATLCFRKNTGVYLVFQPVRFTRNACCHAMP